ncbi:MAG TPA: hypothetical protein VFG08_02065 [Candidatus Polarisedimenticolia bacterium]|nr:hypothetical protein [Candidatus Polarisedimenticolia bacterium]
MNLLRDSFAGINERFHLVGFYTLIVLLLRITVTVLGRDAEWFGLLMLSWVVAWGMVFGILGVAYHAAAGRRPAPSFARCATFLFLPLVWLQLRLELLAYSPAVLGLWGVHSLAAPAQPLQEWMETARYWIDPLATLVILALSLYAMPLCIYDREQGGRGAPIRQGLRMYRESRIESRRLLLLVVAIAVLGGVGQVLHGPTTTDLVPGIPEGLLLFASSYLSLVVFFGATRVVLARRARAQPGTAPAGAPPAAGPED